MINTQDIAGNRRLPLRHYVSTPAGAPTLSVPLDNIGVSIFWRKFGDERWKTQEKVTYGSENSVWDCLKRQRICSMRIYRKKVLSKNAFLETMAMCEKHETA